MRTYTCLLCEGGREGGDCAAPGEGSRKRVPGCDTATCLKAHPTPYRPLPVQRYLIQLQDLLAADRIRGNLFHNASIESEIKLGFQDFNKVVKQVDLL